MPIYIIEHLEKRLWKWCIIEYKHISRIVGKKNLWVTNLKGGKELQGYGRVIKKSVSILNLENAYVIEPEAEKTLMPQEAKKVKYFIFGGILGDNPPKKRTKEELTSSMKNVAVRNIGKKQFSTDNAVYVVKQIVKGIPISGLKFQDGVEIQMDECSFVRLPYRYNVIDGKPLISEELVNYLKRKRSF